MSSADNPDRGDVHHLMEQGTIGTNPLDGLGQDDTFLTLVNRVKELVKDRRLVLCIHPQLFVLKLFIQLVGLDSSLPRHLLASIEQVENIWTDRDQPWLLIATEHVMDGSGLDLIRTMKRQGRDLQTLLVLTSNHRIHLATAVAAGTNAIVLEESIEARTGALISALTALRQQECFIDPAFEDWAIDQAETALQAIEPLSPRQQEILNLVAEGLGNKDIAHRIHIAPSTARDHVQAIMQKFGVQSRSAAAVMGIRLGLVSIDRESFRTRHLKD